MSDNSEFKWIEPRDPGSINWYGLWTLYKKEVQRFFKIFLQTIAAPIATTILFMAIFTLALGKPRPDINGVPFIEFLAPGLIMMSILQQAFNHTSSSLLIAKIQGNIVDILMPPISALEMNVAISMGGVTRGVIVAMASLPCIYFIFVPTLGIEHLWAILFFAISGSLLLSQLGIVTGIWSEKFDHLGTITNFIIVPLSFLSGTFYSVERMPGFARILIDYNPFFYIIDGFRYGFIGTSDSSVIFGVYFITFLNLGMWVLNFYLFKKGWRLKT